MTATIHRFPARKPNRRRGSIPAMSPRTPLEIAATTPDPSLAGMTLGDRAAELSVRAEVLWLHRQIEQELTAAGVTAILTAAP
jgi:hypothetical protein